MGASALQMNRFTLRFADAGTEERFAREQAQKSLRPVRILAIAMGVINAAAILAVIFFAPEVVGSEMTTWMGLAISVALVVAIYAVTLSELFLRWHQWVMLFIAATASAIVIRGSFAAPPDVFATRGYVVLLVTVFVIYSVFRLRFPLATAAGVLSACSHVAVAVALGLLSSHDAFRHAAILAVANAWGMVICYQMEVATRREFAAMHELVEERARSERLLLNILPASIAERLKVSDAAIADHSDEVTVLFADIVGFTPLSARKTPQALVALLNRVFTEFDALADEHGLEKIKTIGDAYMAVAGIPERRPDHAQAAARMAQGMIEAVGRVAAETGEALSVRIGLHSGAVVAGVIGRKKFIYDLWGDTVNTASRMESHGLPGTVQCSEATAALLRNDFALSARGPVAIEGKGEMHTFLLMATK